MIHSCLYFYKIDFGNFLLIYYRSAQMRILKLFKFCLWQIMIY